MFFLGRCDTFYISLCFGVLFWSVWGLVVWGWWLGRFLLVANWWLSWNMGCLLFLLNLLAVG